MAPSFFSKLVKPSTPTNSAGARDGLPSSSTSSTHPSASSLDPSASAAPSARDSSSTSTSHHSSRSPSSTSTSTSPSPYPNASNSYQDTSSANPPAASSTSQLGLGMPSFPYTRQRTQTMPASAQTQQAPPPPLPPALPPAQGQGQNQGSRLSAISPDDSRRPSGAATSTGGTSPRRTGARTPDSTSTRESVQIGVIPPSPRTAQMQFDNDNSSGSALETPTPSNPGPGGYGGGNAGGGGPDVIERDFVAGANGSGNGNGNGNGSMYTFDPQASLRRPKSQERSVPDRHALSYAMRPTTADDEVLGGGGGRGSQNLDEFGGFVQGQGQGRPGSRDASPRSSRALTPASSTGNLRGFVDHPRGLGNPNASGYASGSGTLNANANGSGERLRPDASASVQRKGSARSPRSQTTPLAVDVARSNADPGDGTAPPRPYSQAQAQGAPPPPPKQGLVESPTQLNAPHPSQIPQPTPHPNESTSALSSRSTTGSNGGAAGGTHIPKKKKSWVATGARRPSAGAPAATSPGRKGTGIAGALAASGMAMAHATSAHGTQIPAVPVLPPHANARANANGNGNANGNAGAGASRTRVNHAASASVGSVSGVRAPSSVGSPSERRARHVSTSRSDMSGEGAADSAGSGGSESEDDEDEDDEDDDDDEFGFEAGDIPVTGFAVASSKRNADFHELFPNIPEGDYLIEDYGCALQREILIQGRLYISENHICFHANIFGWITDLSIPTYEIIALEKKMTAFVIPNAIQLTTRQAKYTFASFLARDTAYDVIANIWRFARPEDAVSISNAGGAGMDSRNGSFTTAAMADASDGDLVREKSVGSAGAAGAGAGAGEKAAPAKKEATHCACSKNGGHYSETALETVLPGTPDKIYNLMFASGFIKDFMRVDQKLLDIQIADWAPTGDSKLLARNMSYIKPLNNSMGPKQTKCEIRDEALHYDFDEYVVMLTTTRTPDVPSGGAFSVKTRTCLMWAGAVATRVIVTTQVEWTGRSFIKALIERSAIEGQKVYHADLDKAMRMYIQEHASEFIPSGVDPTAVAPPDPVTPSTDHPRAGSPGLADVKADPVSAAQARENERNARGLQWAYDTFDGAYGVARRSTAGALELIRDAWDQSSSTTILYFAIVVLVLSNIWTLALVGRREEVGRRKEARKMEEREKWVQGIVTGVWEEMAIARVGRVGGGPGVGDETLGSPLLSVVPPAPSGAEASGGSGDVHGEIASIERTLNAIESRVKDIRSSLHATD